MQGGKRGGEGPSKKKKLVGRKGLNFIDLLLLLHDYYRRWYDNEDMVF